MAAKAVGIVCAACGAETFVKREPVYDGFVKVGERFRCVSCGHEYGDEKDVPFRTPEAPKVFGADDAPGTVDVFTEDEKNRNCRHCRHYVVNPFTQRCAHHRKEVEATDLCPDFEPPDTASTASPTE